MTLQTMKRPQIMEAGAFRNSWHRLLPNDDYHSRKEFLSSSMLKDFRKSPYEFKYRHILGNKVETTAAMQLGTAVHLALLEPEEFAKRHVVQPTFSGTGMRNAKTEWLKSLPGNALVLSEDESKIVSRIAESVAEHKEAAQLLRICHKEHSGFYQDEQTGILCRLRPDLCLPAKGILADVKTTRDHRIEAFSRDAYTNGYHLQLAMYAYGIEKITGYQVKASMFLACNTTEPYEVALYVCDDEMMARGKSLYHNLMERLKSCLEADNWPRYQTQNSVLSLPKWAMYE